MGCGPGSRLPAARQAPPLPRRPQALPTIEADAVGHRIDLQIARMELVALANRSTSPRRRVLVTLLDVAASTGAPATRSAPFRERGFDVQFQIPMFDGGECASARPPNLYLAFNRLTEQAINVRSEAPRRLSRLPLELGHLRVTTTRESCR